MFASYIRVLKLGAVNFWRNRWLSLAAILVLTLALLIISVFLILNLVIHTTTNSIKEKIDLEVYFQDEISETEIRTLEKNIATRPDVKNAEYISKSKALEIWQSRQKGEIRSFVSEEENPLPRSLKIKTKDASDIKSVTEFLEKSDYKDYIRKISSEENQPIIDKIISISLFSRKIGFAVSVGFGIIALIVIITTIQMSIFIRKEEIGIMRLVGANSFYIKIPFVIESIFYGIGATILAIGVLILGLKFLMPMIISYFGQTSFDLKQFFYANFWQVLLWQLLLSVFVSVTAALISMRRYLRV